MGVLCPGPLHQGRRQWLPGGLASVVPSVSGRLPNQRSLQKCCLVAGGRGRWPCSESRTWHPQAVEQCECPWEFRGLQGEPARWGSPDALHPDGHEGEGATPFQVTDIPQDLSQGAEWPVVPTSVPGSPRGPRRPLPLRLGLCCRKGPGRPDSSRAGGSFGHKHPPGCPRPCSAWTGSALLGTVVPDRLYSRWRWLPPR